MHELDTKFTDFEEFNTGALFFARSTLIKFINTCFKHASFENFMDEFNNVIEKIREIEEISYLQNNIIKLKKISNLTVINLFNSKIKLYESIKELIEEVNIEEILLANNYLEYFDLTRINTNITKIDISFNLIQNITYTDILQQYKSLNFLNISYNKISNAAIIIDINNLLNIDSFSFICNPCVYELSKQLKSLETLPFQHFWSTKLIKDESLSLNIESKEVILDPDYYIYRSTGHKYVEMIYMNYSFSDNFLDFVRDHFSFSDDVKGNKIEHILMMSKMRLLSIPLLKPQNKVKIVYFNNNKIEKIENLNGISGSLEGLYINCNRIRDISNFENMEEISKLKYFSISNNYLTTLEGITFLKNLISLNVENNMITTLRGCESLTNLIELNASGNNISSLSDCLELKKLGRLIIFDLLNNKASSNNFEFRMFVIFHFEKLKILNRLVIEKSEVKTAKDYFKGKLTEDIIETKIGKENTLNVTELDLESCKLKDFENIFGEHNFPSVTKMNLSKNMFSSFKIFGKLTKLKELKLNYNLFEKFMNKSEKPVAYVGLLGISVIYILIKLI